MPVVLVENPDPSLIQTDILMERPTTPGIKADIRKPLSCRDRSLIWLKKNTWLLEKVMALNTSGLTWWTLGDHKRALRELENALETSRTLKARRDETATTLNNMGLVYRDMGEFPKALDTLNQALAIDRDIKSRWAIAYDLKNLGLTYLQMEQPPKGPAPFPGSPENGNRHRQSDQRGEDSSWIRRDPFSPGPQGRGRGPFSKGPRTLLLHGAARDPVAIALLAGSPQAETGKKTGGKKTC